MNPAPILKKVKKKAKANILSQNNYINWSGVKLGGLMSKYIKVFCVMVLFVVLMILQTNCARKYEKSPAYQRWGITKPLTDTIVEKELASAYKLLYDLQFKDAKTTYENVIVKYPASAEAHLGLSMVYRYLGKMNDAVTECQQALALDSNAVGILLNYADLLAPFRGAKLPGNMSDSTRFTLCHLYYTKALRLKHPLSTYAHIGLWNIYFSWMRQLPMARKQMFELGKKNYFPKMLKDFAYNILITAEPDAIIFTNGDNDTYPLLCLQEYKNVRRDVSVVNINLLNVPQIAMLLRDSLKVPISYRDSELMKMKPQKDPKGFWVYPADNLIANIVENGRKLKRPIYFAITVDRNRIPYYVNFFVNEGLAERMADIKTKDSINIDKVTENINKKFRLSHMANKEIWFANLSPLTRDFLNLSFNYAALGVQTAAYYEQHGDKRNALHYYQWVYKILEKFGKKEYLEPIQNKIKELKK